MNVSPLERLKRLGELLSLASQEINSLVHGLEERAAGTSTDAPIPSSAASSIGLDMEEIAKQIEVETKVESSNVNDGDNVTQVEKLKLWGGQSSILKFLSPTIIHGGRGFIKPTATFQQYEEDIMKADPDRVLGWPAGFYRNRDSKDEQLLVHVISTDNDRVSYCLDALPSNDGRVRIIHSLVGCQAMSGELTDFNARRLNFLHENLIKALDDLYSHHFNSSVDGFAET